MQMTMHVDEALLARVMEATGTTSKTRAIDLALREMDRRAKLLDLSRAGLSLAPEELRDAVDPAYNLDALRRREIPATASTSAKFRASG